MTSIKGYIEIIEILIEKSCELKIDLNAKDYHNQRTAFHLACKNGHMKIVGKFLKKSFDINAKDRYEDSAFQLACENGHSEIAAALVLKSSDFKINLNAKNSHHRTGFH